MSTINSQLPLPPASADTRQALGRSLTALSARARPAAPADDLDETQVSDVRFQALRQVAQQNRLSALADGPAAAAAAQAASSDIAANPPGVIAAQANASPEGAWRVLQTEM